MQIRENALKEWLETIIGHQRFTLSLLAGDASFRRYFRVTYDGINQILMDAPPEKESTKPFLEVDKILTAKDILTPRIYAVNAAAGFILLEDFGDQLLLNTLNAENVDGYYKKAMDILFRIQADLPCANALPEFNTAFMLEEMDLFKTWFLENYLSLRLTNEEKQLINNSLSKIADEIQKLPQVMIHRDYHSRNLMVIGDQLGVIDFQDAMLGPVCYDLVSLLKDCYISWPRAALLEWLNHFHQRSTAANTMSFEAFTRAFDLCGLQRHLKVLGIFSRLYLRDGKSAYLKDLPLTLNYVMACGESYIDMHPFCDFMKTRIVLP